MPQIIGSRSLLEAIKKGAEDVLFYTNYISFDVSHFKSPTGITTYHVLFLYPETEEITNDGEALDRRIIEREVEKSHNVNFMLLNISYYPFED